FILQPVKVLEKSPTPHVRVARSVAWDRLNQTPAGQRCPPRARKAPAQALKDRRGSGGLTGAAATSEAVLYAGWNSWLVLARARARREAVGQRFGPVGARNVPDWPDFLPCPSSRSASLRHGYTMVSKRSTNSPFCSPHT